MLPIKINELIVKLVEKTEAGQIQWVYDDESTSVSAQLPSFSITIEYSFNMLEEVGQYRVIYFDFNQNQQYYFMTSQMYNDYELVRRLFDSAQSSGLNIDLNF
ncbi:hypothetical protein MND25_004687 [Vibrio parahaemolyticus]|nr:hypothetical protein [Vibrio parahaemolyticus]